MLGDDEHIVQSILQHVSLVQLRPLVLNSLKVAFCQDRIAFPDRSVSVNQMIQMIQVIQELQVIKVIQVVLAIHKENVIHVLHVIRVINVVQVIQVKQVIQSLQVMQIIQELQGITRNESFCESTIELFIMIILFMLIALAFAKLTICRNFQFQRRCSQNRTRCRRCLKG